MDVRAVVVLAFLASQAPGAIAQSGSMIGKTIEAESLRADRSAGYAITQNASARYLQFIDRGSHLCYDDVDLTGVRSIDYRYAKGDGEPPRRFAVMVFDGPDFHSATRINLGERITTLTGGWETFRTERIGLWLLVASLGRQELRLVRLDSGKVTKEEVVIANMGRIRDVLVGPDGSPYIVLNFPNGMILRLVALDGK